MGKHRKSLRPDNIKQGGRIITPPVMVDMEAINEAMESCREEVGPSIVEGETSGEGNEVRREVDHCEHCDRSRLGMGTDAPIACEIAL